MIVIINPGELLAQARDSQRMRDMATVRDAINLFMVQAPTASLCDTATGGGDGCAAGGICTFNTAIAAGPFSTVTPATPCSALPTFTNLRLTNGTGWVDINFDANPAARTITTLPIDPINDATHFYAYRAETVTRTFRLATRLESVRHRVAMLNDGGPRSTCSTWIENTCFYEVGTNMLVGF